ncbi:MAG: 16S rRNA (uracil(1498)-N(3))-methyltransferase [Deferribacteres bacterium]|nr:16S rRNA (uracil(1498)-N(3))-methyltransferase [candidate division KSB1 bacterium]MCB9504010.1 16S rRNA (uracil(1498)-N(3))-methyltransferase [Deferribacteres bacterium]
MSRNEFFYVSPSQCPLEHENAIGQPLLLRDEEHRHLFKVLRHQAGDQIFVTSGDGRTFDCEISAIEKQRSILTIQNVIMEMGEPQFKVTIAQAIPKLNRFEWFLEKAVEIGASEIWPMQTQYTELFPNKLKSERWQKILLAAMKQCGRSQLPAMQELRTFEEILSATNQFDITFIAHAPVPGNAITWSSQAEIPQVKSALLLIGPEGGFSEDELEKAIASGYRFLHLGPTRLRSETAGLVAAALLLNQLDNR